MTRVDGFLRGAVFAAVAAAAYAPWIVTFGGGRRAFALYLVTLTAGYLFCLGERGTRRLLVAGGAALLGCVVAAAAHSITELALGLGVVLATARSAALWRARTARAVVTEVGLVGGGLVFARMLAAPSVFGVMLAVWGFFLVQSLFFLVGGVVVR